MESALVSATQNHKLFKNRTFAFFSHVDFNLVRFRLPLMKTLLEAGANVIAICPEGDVTSQFEQNGVKYVPFDLDRTTFNPIVVMGVVKRLAGLLSEHKPDVLHTFTLRPNALGALAGKEAGVPIIINTVTGLGSLYSANLGIKGDVAKIGVNFLTRRALRSSSAVVFQNPDDRDYYVNHSICSDDQVRMIIGSGVDTEQFSAGAIGEEQKQPLRESYSLTESDIVVTMIARLLAPKGVREFLAAAKQLNTRAKFVLIGDPDPDNPASISRDQLAKFIDSGDLIAPGHQDNIAEWLAISDIYVLPSYREGLPRTVLEAMSMGLPIVTTDVPGCKETIVNNENGLLIPARDSEALIRALEVLLEDQELRQTMGRRSRELVVERFSNDVILGQYLDLYAELCENTLTGS